ncbi:MAG: rRNA pseudouridine synthase [Clostridia bacterium]|nr:rRNA pseudouridine synthase [Clostridia bacterium]
MAGLRLDKILSKSGFGSRKDVKKLILGGRVSVNGKAVTDSSFKANPEDIFVDGNKISYREFIYVLMNKPQGVISSTEKGRTKTVIDLLDDDLKSYSPFPVGRLDIDTEGLLLITNDGPLAHNLLAPKKHVDKTYYAKIKGVVTDIDVQKFNEGLDIGEDKPTLPATLKILESGETSEIEVTICEGKFHQVKRMFHAVGKEVVFLKRIKMGNLTLPPDLETGDYIEISIDDIQNAQKED